MSLAARRLWRATTPATPGNPDPGGEPGFDARFPGDPGEGNFYYGGREDQLTWTNSAVAIQNWEDRMSPWSGGAKLSIIRVFSQASVVDGFTHRALCNTHYSNGRMPHVSFKLPSGLSAADAANQAGSFSAWMDGLASAFQSFAPKPIWWTFWHEPENDADWQGATGEARYRQVCRNIKQALVSRGVVNATFWTTGYMCPYTFGDAGGTRDWRAWYPDWKGTTAAGSSKNNPNPVDFYLPGDSQAVVDGIGLDIYSWWDEGDSQADYQSFDTLFMWAHSRMGFLGLPYNIMEHGVQALHTGVESQGTAVYDVPATLNYLSAMYDIMIQKNIVAMQVYNYALVQNAWRLEIEDPQRIRYQGYGVGLTRPNHVQYPF